MRRWFLLFPLALLLGSCAHASKESEQTAEASPTPAVAAEATPIPAPVPSATAATPAAQPTLVPAPIVTPSVLPIPAVTPSVLPVPTSGRELEVIATPIPVAIPSPTLAPPTNAKAQTPIVSLGPTAPSTVHVSPQQGRYAGRIASPQDPPKIFSVEISDATPTSGETVSGKVVTTTNVAAVTGRIAGISMGFHRSDFGVFTLTYTLPGLPFFLKHAYTVEITAITSDGRTTKAAIPIRVR